jgi:hypothetical protein
MGMKCVQCNTDNNLRDRTNNSGRCKQCNHPFLFDPTTITDKKIAFTDSFFKKAIEDISSQNMLFFTPKQFLYLIDKRLKYRASADGCQWLVNYVGLKFAVTFISGISFTPIFANVGLAFLIPFIIFNVAGAGIFFVNSNSPRQGIRARQFNAIKLKFVGGIILAIGFPLSLAAGSFAGYIAVIFLGLLFYWLGTSQKNRIYRFIFQEGDRRYFQPKYVILHAETIFVSH